MTNHATVMMIFLLMIFVQSIKIHAGENEKEAAKLALEYVSRVEQSPCTGGTEETLDLIFNHTTWREYTQPAILTSNFLTSVILENGGSLDTLTDEILFSLVRNNVNGQSIIFGSAIAIETGLYTKYSSFCPYAYRKNGTVFAHDISLSYNYLDSNTEWYYVLKTTDWENATRTISKIKYRSGGVSLPEQQNVLLTAKLLDGHWTMPYFDCGGGDVWMVTFSSPIFSLNGGGEPKFQGVATIDIELTNIDINQCDPDTSTFSALDVFRGTHRCPETTECNFLPGLGFKRGAYQCVCSKGYYFPDSNSEVKAFSGKDVENYLSLSNTTDFTHYTCLSCKEGCTECVDDSPCLYEFLFVFRFMVLLITMLTCTAIGILFIVTAYFRNELAIKTGSPIFLLFMCAGGMLMCSTGFFAYPKALEFLCVIQIWVFHIGFNFMYGALVVKTWRIAVIFRPTSKLQRINLPDKELLKRFFPMMIFVSVYLLAWSIAEKGETGTLETSSLLKYDVCLSSYWLYAIQCAEVCLLLVGVYICYMVRKAPGHFNESKYITWSIYNGIILGSFLLILTHLIGHSYGPDLLYLLQGLQIQAFVTITLTLIFIPKLLALYKKEDVKRANDTFATAYASKYIRTNNIEGASTKTVGTQTYENVTPDPKEKTFWTSLTKISNNRVEPIVDHLSVPTTR
ncbi:metabotropic glycine receptor-like [Mytilus trossulus]|uniref:metabotropic glycine receptor-like n=1 Tax=Mytilus trossulus TaxID=6551 RepID=UPI0030040AA3